MKKHQNKLENIPVKETVKTAVDTSKESCPNSALSKQGLTTRFNSVTFKSHFLF